MGLFSAAVDNGIFFPQMSHTDAVALLSQPAKTVTLQLMFVPPEDDDTSSLPDDPFAFKCVISLAGFSCLPTIYYNKNRRVFIYFVSRFQ